MFRPSPTLRDAAARTFDYLIIGAGSGGCAAAGEIARRAPDATIGMLESGPVDGSVFDRMPFAAGAVLPGQIPIVKRRGYQMFCEPEPTVANRTLYWPSGRGVGGSSTLNAMIYIRGNPDDYNTWHALGADGWAWDDVLPWFRALENNSRGACAYHGDAGLLRVSDALQGTKHEGNVAFKEACMRVGMPANDDFNGATQDGVGFYQSTRAEGLRWHASQAFLRSLTPAGRGMEPPYATAPGPLPGSNVTLIPDCGVERLVLAKGSGGGLRAVGVEATTLTMVGSPRGAGETYYARKEVIVAAGAMRSPALLQKSGVGGAEEVRAAGAELVHELPGVGHNLQDHCDVTIVFETKHFPETVGGSMWSLRDMARGVRQWHAGGDARRKSMATGNLAEGGFFTRLPSATTKPGVPNVQGHFCLGPVMQHGRKVPIGWDGLSLHVCNLYPKSTGRVQATPGRLTEPRIRHGYFTDAGGEDLATMEDAYRLAQDIVNGPEFAKFGMKPRVPGRWLYDAEDIREFIRTHSETIYHPIGTCKMGREDDSAAVVDAQLRVRGIERLRVADASVMPRLVGGNTNAPSIMIGARCGDFVVGDALANQELPTGH